MLLKKLYIENVRSYEKQEIIFPKGSTLLSGDIGSGKTSILLAIEFALFGLQPSQKGSSLLRNGTDNCKVILEFEIDNKQIIIERTLKKNKSISQDYASITIEGDKFEGSVTEIKTKVLQLLNYPSEFAKKTNLLYKFTVYTPQEEMKQIILESGDTRLNTLRHVFGVDKYKRIEENSAFLTAKLREKIRLNEGMFYDLEEEKKILQQRQENLVLLKEKQKQAILDYEKVTEFKTLKEQALNEIQEKINEKRALETEKAKSIVLISEKKQQITSLENSIKSLKLQLEEGKKIFFNLEEFDALNQRIKFQENRQDELQKEYMELIGAINSLDYKNKESNDLKNKISKLQNCPTCLQEVSSGYKDNIFNKINQELETITKQLQELNVKKIQTNASLEQTKKIKEDFKKQKSEFELAKIKLENIKEKEQRILEIEKQKNLLQKDLEMLDKHMKSLDISIIEFEKYDILFKERNKELIEAKNNENQCAIKKAEANKEVQFSEIQIKEKQEQINKKESIKQKTEKLREIEYWISERFMGLVLFTEKQVLLTLKEEFSKLFSKWFSTLVSDSLTAKLDDDFSPIIEQQDYELDYAFLSGGERTAIALAYRLSLNQVINSLLSKIKTGNLIILDEPTDGFSSQQLDKMREVFDELNAGQLILVSHEPKIEGFVDNIIRFKKEKGITKVEV
ncbi:MAG: AAA family ATPase [Candidatus Pacearchaeota archaeon]